MQTKKKICHFCSTEQYIWKNVDGKKACKPCSQKIKPTERLKPSRSPIPKFSNKRKKEQVAYSALRKMFLLRRPNCEMRIPNICTLQATEVHHPAGRIGERFLNDSEWIPGCHNCHCWVTEHPKESLELGLTKLRLKTTKDG